jgi:hypothetical protein
MKKTTELTAGQKALLPMYRDRWMNIGLSTDRCDRAKAEDAARRAYRVANLEPPDAFVWFESPLGIAEKTYYGQSLRYSLSTSVWRLAAISVQMTVDPSVRIFISESIYDPIDFVAGCSIIDSVHNCVRSSLREFPAGFSFGSQDAPMFAIHSFFHDVLGVNGCDLLQPLMDMAVDCGWWMPCKGVCFMSEKPIAINLADGEVHSDSGPAIEYADGFKIWAIEGVLVDEQIVMQPERQTIKQIEREENEEIKRIRLNRYGWQRYLQETEAQVLDVSVHDWMESLMLTRDGITVLCTYDPSTGRPYALEVDPLCKTCEEAQRYLLSPEDSLSRAGIDTSKIKTYPLARS